MDENEKNKKIESRKFVVWITWLVITIFVLIWCGTIMFITKKLTDNLIGLAEKVLSWFFAVSMMYLGMNVSQKVGLAFADSIFRKEDIRHEIDEDEEK